MASNARNQADTAVTDFEPGKTPLDTARKANLPKYWKLKAIVQDVHLAYAVLGTPAGTMALNTITDGVLSGRPSITLERNNSMRLNPAFQETLAREYELFSREALASLIALGFVPIKIYDDVDQNLRVPFVPDINDVEFHIIENKVTTRHKLMLYHTRLGYDENTVFYVQNMPFSTGQLRSRASTLFDDFRLMVSKYKTSNVLDTRIASGEVFVRSKPVEQESFVDKTTRRGVQSINSMFSRAANAVQQSGTQDRRLTTNSETLGQLLNDDNDDEDEIRIRSFDVQGTNGQRTVWELDEGTDIVNPGQQRRVDDLQTAREMYNRAIIGVIGLPPALFSDKVLAHGKGLEELNQEVNVIISRWAETLRSILQKAYDVSYAGTDEQKLREQIVQTYTNRAVGKQLSDVLEIMQQRVDDTYGIQELFATTSQELQSQAFVTEEEYHRLLDEHKVRVLVVYDLRISVKRIYDIAQMGTIDEKTAHEMVLRTLRLDRDLAFSERSVVKFADKPDTGTSQVRRKAFNATLGNGDSLNDD